MTQNYYLKKHGLFLEDLKIGQKANYKKISEEDINIFADITGDNNRFISMKNLQSSPFLKGFYKEPGSLISTVIATKLPGPGSIYLNQSLKFLAPVFIGDIVNAQVTINDIQIENKKVILLTECFISEKKVLTGQAEILVSVKEEFK